MRLTEYLDPENIYGFAKQTAGRLADPERPFQQWGQKLYDQGKAWTELSLPEKSIALEEAVIELGGSQARIAAAGYGGMAELARTQSLDEAVKMVSTISDSDFMRRDAQSPGGRLAVDTLGTLAEPLEPAARAAGDATLSLTSSPEDAAAVYSAVGVFGPGKGKGRSKHTNKRVMDADGRLIDRPKKMTDVPDIRGVDVKRGLEMAEYEPHLMPTTAAGEGKYMGGPRNVHSRRDLTNMRGRFDEIVERGQEAGDWYDRYREDITEVTGGDVRDNLWMANAEAQYSAGVSPEVELGFTLKDQNSAIAYGTPTKPSMPAQQKASAKAIAENDPSQFQLGDKTAEYARKINPLSGGSPTATSVNDFRHARNFDYRDPEGLPQTLGLRSTEHTFIDYETALAVSRANQGRLAGRSDWNGEQVQAAAWVVQKADDFYARNKNGYTERAEALIKKEGRNESVDDIARELAFEDANRTIGDFFDKHTASATHEPQPYVKAGHLPKLADASDAEKAAFASDPRSRWDFAPGGRDAIYGGMRLGDTGVSMRTRPTHEMQGIYDPPGAPREYNPGFVARPLVAFNNLKDGTKTLPAADRGLMDAAEATRAYVDVQGAGAWHKSWPQMGGNNKSNTSLMIARDPGKGSVEEMGRLAEIGERYGMPDLVDTGQGYTMSKFYEGPPDNLPKKEFSRLLDEVDEVVGPDAVLGRANVDAGYLPMWENDAGVGSGQVTRAYLAELDKLPEATVRAIDNNPLIPKAAAMRLERDAQLASKYGTNRKDVQKAREIIAGGPGFIDRLRKAVDQGLVPAAAAAALIGVAAENEEQI